MTFEYIDPQSLADSYRSIGVIAGARGMQGELRLKPWDPQAPWVDTLKSAVLTSPGKIPRPLTIEWARLHGDMVWMRVREITTREEAERMKGMELKALDSDLPECGEDEFYVEQLVGLQVKSLDSDKIIGTVAAISSSSAGDFLEVQPEGWSDTVLVPFQDTFVRDVDMAGQCIYITGLDSLFEP